MEETKTEVQETPKQHPNEWIAKLNDDVQKAGDTHNDVIRFTDALTTDYGVNQLTPAMIKGSLGKRDTNETIIIDDLFAKSMAQLGNNLFWGAGVVGGKIQQIAGDLSGNQRDTDLGVYYQDYARRRMLNYADQLDYAYDTSDATFLEKTAAGALQAGASVLPVLLTGGSALAGTAIAGTFAFSGASEYLAELDSELTPQEWKELQESKSLGQQLADFGSGAAVGAIQFYLDKAFGALPALENLGSVVSKGAIKNIAKPALEEATTEVFQDLTPTVVDFVRGKKELGDVWNQLVSEDTAITFLSSMLVGGLSGGTKYYSARERLGEEVRRNVDSLGLNLTEGDKEKVVQGIQKKLEKAGAELARGVIVDDQLRNQYGTSRKAIRNRLNELIHTTTRRDENMKPFYIASLEQEVIEKLYIDAKKNNLPVSEVLDNTKLYVDGNNLVMENQYDSRTMASIDEMGGLNVHNGELQLLDNIDRASLVEDLAKFFSDNLILGSKTTNFDYTSGIGKASEALKRYLGVNEEQDGLTKRQLKRFVEDYEEYLKTGTTTKENKDVMEFMDAWLARLGRAYFADFEEGGRRNPEKITDEIRNKIKGLTTQDITEPQTLAEALVPELQPFIFSDLGTGKQVESQLPKSTSRRTGVELPKQTHERRSTAEVNKLADAFVRDSEEAAFDILAGNRPEGQLSRQEIYMALERKFNAITDPNLRVEKLVELSEYAWVGTEAGKRLRALRGNRSASLTDEEKDSLINWNAPRAIKRVNEISRKANKENLDTELKALKETIKLNKKDLATEEDMWARIREVMECK